MRLLVSALLALALLLVLPAPAARGYWIECSSSRPGEIEATIVLTTAREEIDPASERLVWRTIGPTEKVFYEGPRFAFTATIDGLAPGDYSLAYEYSGPDGSDRGRFCDVRVAGEANPQPNAGETPGRSDRDEAVPDTSTPPSPAAQPTIAETATTDTPSLATSTDGVPADAMAPRSTTTPVVDDAAPPATLRTIVGGLSLLSGGLLLSLVLRRRRVSR